MKNNRGKFIVIEGLDGCGGETQSNLLMEFFKKNNIACEKKSYPDYSGPIGGLIHQFLYEKYDFSAVVQALLYFADFLKDKEGIEKWLEGGGTVVADRYFHSTLAYQGLKHSSIDSILKLADIFDLPKPDLVIYIKISPGTSADRKYKEKGSLDRHEADKEFLGRLSTFYDGLIERQVFGEWITVDGERPIEEVAGEIKLIVRSKLNIKEE
jgi:dTMP kinase